MFSDLTTLETLQLFLPIILLELGLKIYAFTLLIKGEVQHLPKWGWALIILLVSTFGPITFLFVGRKKD